MTFLFMPVTGLVHIFLLLPFLAYHLAGSFPPSNSFLSVAERKHRNKLLWSIYDTDTSYRIIIWFPVMFHLAEF